MGIGNWRPDDLNLSMEESEWLSYFYLNLPDRDDEDCDIDDLCIDLIDEDIRAALQDTQGRSIGLESLGAAEKALILRIVGSRANATKICSTAHVTVWRVYWYDQIVILLVAHKVLELLLEEEDFGTEQVGKRLKRAVSQLGCRIDRYERAIIKKIEENNFQASMRTSAWTSAAYRSDPTLPDVPLQYGGRQIWSQRHRAVQFAKVSLWLTSAALQKDLEVCSHERHTTVKTRTGIPVATTHIKSDAEGEFVEIELHI